MFKKIWKFVSNPSVDRDLDELDGGLTRSSTMKEEERFKPLRHSLVAYILNNEEISGIIKTMVEMETSKFYAKYDALDVRLLLHANNDSVKSLQNIISGLSMIAKYAQHLLKKKDQFKSIPLHNPHVKSKILPMNGKGLILQQLGYSQQTDSSFSFPQGMEPDVRKIANLLADIQLFKVEMRYYLSDCHVNPEQIDDLLPKNTLLELRQSEVTLPGDISAMQSIMLDSSMENKEEQSQTGGSSSTDSSPYYSATSDSVNKESSEDSPREGKLMLIDERQEENNELCVQGEKTEKERPMQDFNVQETAVSESTSLRNSSSSGFNKFECDVCSAEPVFICRECTNKMLCSNCETFWHFHPSRRDHVSKKLSEIDLLAVLNSQDAIVESPYGLIAQTENSAALINKKIIAATKKIRKGSDAVDGVEAAGMERTQEDGAGKPTTGATDMMEKEDQVDNASEENQAGNMPDFGSIMSGNTGFNENNSQWSQQSSDLRARGGNQKGKTQPQFGNGQNVYDNSQQQQQQMQQQLPQFLQDSGQPVVMPNVRQGLQNQYHGHFPASVQHAPHYADHPLQPIPTQYSGQRDPRQSESPDEQLSPPMVQSYSIPNKRISDTQSDFSPRQAHRTRETFPHRAYSQPVGDVHPQQLYFYHNSPMGNNQDVHYNPNMPQAYHTTHFQETAKWKNSPQLGQHQTPHSLNDLQDEDQTFVQYPPYMYRYSVNTLQYPRMPHPMLPVLQNPSLKPSQAYPQLTHKQLNEPNDVPAIQRSVSTPPASCNPASKIIQLILSQPLALRAAVCKFKIDDLDREINELQKKIDDLQIDDANEIEVGILTTKRRELLRTKKELVKFSQELKSAKEDDELEIYFPPVVNSKPVVATSQKEACEDEEKFSPRRRSPTKELKRNSPTEGICNLALESQENSASKVYKSVTTSNGPNLSNGPNSMARNIPEEESIIDNPSPIGSCEYKDPGKISLKADDSLPNLKWNCEHCTFLNEAKVTVCVMCHRTTSKKRFVPQDDTDRGGGGGGGKAMGGQDSVVTRVKRHNRISDMQKEEEQLMAEKKKAWEEFYEQGNSQISSSDKPKATSKLSEPDSKPVVERSIKPVSNTGSQSSVVSQKTSGQKEGGFSDLGKQQDTGSSSSSVSSFTTAGSSNSPISKTTVAATCALKKLRDAANTDELKTLGLNLVNVMKEADLAGFNVDAVPIALTFCNSQTMSVLNWLRTNWEKNLAKIVKEVSEVGASRNENNIGDLSEEEAESACIECHGNLKNAVELCVKKRETAFKYLDVRGSYSREEILNALFTHKGDKESAEEDLVRNKLHDFLERTWAEGNGREDMAQVNGNNSHHADLCVSGSNIDVGDDEFQRILKDTNTDKDRRIRMILIEGKLKSWGRAQMVIDILDGEPENENALLEDIIEAVCNCNNKQNAIALLNQQCEICYSHFPMTKIRNLSICQCKLCVECLQGNFEVTIKEKHVSHWTCPLCFLPDMNSAEEYTDYFHMLGLLLSPIVGKDLMQMFENKVRDFTLQNDPSFRWCVHCGYGFLADNRRVEALTCPHCQGKMCFMCKRQWEPQHQNRTCEQFDKWKIDNDPQNQAIGLARHLEENGIDCPQCKMRYGLAKGGCMHFKCPECGFEFCCGCSEKFYQQGVCKRFKSCEQKGFHCHHPRDCFFYLRDNTPAQLQNLLEMNKVAFNVQVPEDQEDKDHCPVMEQKGDGQDTHCGRNVQKEMAGLCEGHYKEYLTGLINKHALDPVFLMEVKDMTNLLNRYEMPEAAQEWEGPDGKAKLLQIIQQQLPLKRKKLGK